MIFIINCCISCTVFGLENASSYHSINSNQDAIGDQTDLRFEQVQFAKTVRNLIDLLCQQENCKDLIASLRSKVASEIMISDSSLGNQILNKLDNDSSFIEDCLYVADLKKNWNSIQSEHFIFYFPSIIGLQKSKWASSFYFIYKLVTKYDIEQLLVLMRMTPWKSSVDDFSKNFEEVYGIELIEFEHNILKEINH
jgi:hypothetical protein